LTYKLLVLQASLADPALDVLVFVFLLLAILFMISGIISRIMRARRRLTHRYSLAQGEPVEERIPQTLDTARPFILALKNPDWEARAAAALALGYYGDESAFDPLVKVLLHDSNEVVRQNACSSLQTVGGEKAVDPLMKVIENYLRGVERKPDVAVAAAEALGEIESVKASKTLRELHNKLEKRGLGDESKRVSCAVKKISSAMRRKDRKCIVCNLPIKNGEELVRCPCCGNLAHKTHMLEWLHIRGYCPVCSEKVSESELEEEKQA
jgi:HEAT repeat protein